MNTPHGLIDQSVSGRKNDYLFRLSLKALIVNEKGQVLVVKEAGRTWWDLPGGGMDHDESIHEAIARELFEEVSMTGEFDYRVIDIDEPLYLTKANVWQVRVILHVTPKYMHFKPGEDGEAIAFMEPATLKDSDHPAESRIHRYFLTLSS